MGKGGGKALEEEAGDPGTGGAQEQLGNGMVCVEGSLLRPLLFSLSQRGRAPFIQSFIHSINKWFSSTHCGQRSGLSPEDPKVTERGFHL